MLKFMQILNKTKLDIVLRRDLNCLATSCHLNLQQNQQKQQYLLIYFKNFSQKQQIYRNLATLVGVLFI